MSSPDGFLGDLAQSHVTVPRDGIAFQILDAGARFGFEFRFEEGTADAVGL